MAEKPYALTERDVERLREMYAAHKNRTPPTRPHDTRADDEEWLGPECYVALTPAAGTGTGTSSGSSTGTGSGSSSGGVPARVGLTPGTATCDVFRLVGDTLYGPLFTEDVRNLSTVAVAADSWVIIQRDKSGTWWTVWADATGSSIDGGCRYEVRAGKACLTATSGGGISGSSGGGEDFGEGPNIGTATSQSGPGTGWTDPDSASDGTSYAVVTLAAGSSSQVLTIIEFGFGIPLDATITSVTVAGRLAGGAAGTTVDVKLVPGTGGTGDTVTFTYPSFSTFNTSGNTSSPPWNLALTPADVITIGFGVSFQAHAAGVGATVSLDRVTMEVHYHTPGVTVGGSGSASVTLGYSQTYELIDRQAPCASKVKARWCLRNQGDCCSFSADGDDGAGGGQGDYLDTAMCAQAALPRVPKKLLLVFGPNTLPLADAADPGGVLGTGVRYRNDGFTIPLVDPCTDPTSATSCEGLMQYRLDSTCVIGTNPLPGDPPNVGSQCAFWGEADPPFQLPVRDSQSKLFGVYYGTRGYSTGAALTRDWVVCFSRLDGCNVAGLGPFQLSILSPGTVGRGWSATNCDAGCQVTDPGGAGPDGVWSLFNALMQSRLISDDGSPTAPPPGGPVYADWRNVTLGDGLGLGHVYTIDYILIIDGDL